MTNPEELLADPQALEEADQGGTLRLVAMSGARIRRAAALRELDPEAGPVLDAVAADGRPRALVLLGYGTGATVAKLISAVVGAGASVPILSVPGPALPGWIGPLDLVVVASTTGRSPEIAAALTEAGRRGCRIVVVAPPTSELARLAGPARAALLGMADASAPVWARLWSVAIPALLAVEAAGILPAQSYEAAAAAADDAAVRFRPSQEPFVNPAKEIALRCAEHPLAAWSAGPIATVAAGRLADQAALRAGRPVLHASLPDLGRGQLGLLDGSAAASSEADLFYDPEVDGPRTGSAAPAFVLLSEAQVEPRAAVVEAMLNERNLPLSTVVAEQATTLERAAYLIALADFTACYLAIAVGAGPDQGKAIEEFKLRTAQ
ncbi:SIS domain-containing protein [Actinospica sp.]|uniref:SIS domain-containing protein n=1 Tax=Actinospica sp. TaxID=1872142 RepID=UPI002CE464B6|nr:SIS domain-containing protein [Actinospica sp.]HWG28398.1 SIS domain-containing protein [Actinospica sp.]